MLRTQLLLLSLLLLCLAVGFAWAGRTYEGKVVSVTDGDTIKVLIAGKQIRVRLAEIDTPEKGQPWGRKAREALAEKVAKQIVNVDEIGKDRYGRVIGKVWLGDRYINRELVQEGHAWAYRKYLQDDSLLEDETTARKTRLGLWSLPEAERVPPWEWRQR